MRGTTHNTVAQGLLVNRSPATTSRAHNANICRYEKPEYKYADVPTSSFIIILNHPVRRTLRLKWTLLNSTLALVHISYMALTFANFLPLRFVMSFR